MLFIFYNERRQNREYNVTDYTNMLGKYWISQATYAFFSQIIIFIIYYSSDQISCNQILQTAPKAAWHASSSASTLTASYFRWEQGQRQLRRQNRIFPRENKQVKLSLQVHYDNTQLTMVFPANYAISEVGCAVFGQSPDVNFICKHTTSTKSK